MYWIEFRTVFNVKTAPTREGDAVGGVIEAPHTWAENKYFGHKILMKPSHDCSY